MTAMLLYTRRTGRLCECRPGPVCVDLVAMAAEVAGGLTGCACGRRWPAITTLPAPLRHNAESVQKLLYLAAWGCRSSTYRGTLRGVTGADDHRRFLGALECLPAHRLV